MAQLIRSTANQNIQLTPNGTGVVNMSSDDIATNKVTTNLVIGGNFTTNPWQRGTTFNSLASSSYSADRFLVQYSFDGAVNVTRSTDAPTYAQAGVVTSHSLLHTVATADATIAAGQFYHASYRVEGYDWAKLAQRAFTLSFWVKSNLTGTYCLSFTNTSNSVYFLKEYTINSANTWELKTITVPALTTAGTQNYTNGIGLRLHWCLAVGTTNQGTLNASSWTTGQAFGTSNQVNWCGTISNTFQLALVQLEVGSIATQFRTLDAATILRQCQRYYFKTFPQGTAPAQNVGNNTGAHSYRARRATAVANGEYIRFPVTMRATPTITYYSPKAASTAWYDITGSTASGASGSSGASDSGVFVTNAQAAADAIGDVLSIHLQAAAEL